MLKIRKQIRTLYLNSAMMGFQIAGASWVALLAARGFSLVQIGFAESVFHVVSFCFELPSGVIADVFGRKKSLILSQAAFLVAALLMIFSESFPSVVLAVGATAFGYNFSSGSLEALAYDSLKRVGEAEKYDKFASTEFMLYQIARSAAVLCAGLALFLGYRRAYLIDAALETIGIFVAAFGLTEVLSENVNRAEPVRTQIFSCVKRSAFFLRTNGRAVGLMLWNALVGAIATLVLFFLQARLTADGLPELLLGPALFILGLGGAAGAKAVTGFKQWSYRKLSALCVAIVVCGALTMWTHLPILMAVGGFICGFGDDLLQVRSDIVLNSMVPSEERATLLSVNSLCFSVVMMVLSPVAGVIFS